MIETVLVIGFFVVLVGVIIWSTRSGHSTGNQSDSVHSNKSGGYDSGHGGGL